MHDILLLFLFTFWRLQAVYFGGDVFDCVSVHMSACIRYRWAQEPVRSELEATVCRKAVIVWVETSANVHDGSVGVHRMLL
jgi:hypothetical protein